MNEANRRHPNVVHRDEVPPFPMTKGKHRVTLRRLGAPAGAQMLGACVTELAPHSVSFPLHYHCATEEGVYILRGSGVARIGDARVPVREGDWLSFPVGPEHPHQMINETDEPLVYLCVSANPVKVDVVGYPDSKKVAGTAGTFDKPIHRWISKMGDTLDYWVGEPDANA